MGEEGQGQLFEALDIIMAQEAAHTRDDHVVSGGNMAHGHRTQTPAATGSWTLTWFSGSMDWNITMASGSSTGCPHQAVPLYPQASSCTSPCTNLSALRSLPTLYHILIVVTPIHAGSVAGEPLDVFSLNIKSFNYCLSCPYYCGS